MFGGGGLFVCFYVGDGGGVLFICILVLALVFCSLTVVVKLLCFKREGDVRERGKVGGGGRERGGERERERERERDLSMQLPQFRQ